MRRIDSNDPYVASNYRHCVRPRQWAHFQCRLYWSISERHRYGFDACSFVENMDLSIPTFFRRERFSLVVNKLGQLVVLLKVLCVVNHTCVEHKVQPEDGDILARWIVEAK